MLHKSATHCHVQKYILTEIMEVIWRKISSPGFFLSCSHMDAVSKHNANKCRMLSSIYTSIVLLILTSPTH